MSCSLEEHVVVAVDHLNQVSKTGSSQHHVLLKNWLGKIIVVGGRNLAGGEPWVHVVLGNFVAFGGPSHIVFGQDGG